MINAQYVKDYPYEEIYVLPCFIKNGRQFFVIQPGDTAESIYLQRSVVNYREEDVPPYTGSTFKSQVVRVFKKETSVFRNWRQDNEQTAEKCLDEHDFLFWKLEKFIRDSEQTKLIKELFYTHFQLLKDIYIEL